ncbi:glycine/D-amino acid oxidase-like deaminating enzyme [Agromyces flavus]|uniref:Glycine/D-amino acid oxidase n=1 Tax=Agromyces flavus TaxID=589382 RepID=A0A1H1PWQ7_9MICO|nr:FAD-binding oxidoreductase [Agromyces flavus]MCP2367845.1 glycine/D-amino acid oxidase-like deaminating enzyme [Agromyces flavus]GGI47305.1 oxidoreductase [Agromyces flavus]SDS15625.1 Glycine/D-amino acid oxidase [Agromyces flavus]
MRVVVVGAGAIGASCALAVTEAGAEVVVVDRVGVAAETSSRCEGNILVSDKAPGAEADLAIVARRAWRDLAARLDDDRGPGQPATEFEEKGGVVVAFEGGAAALDAFAASQRVIGIRAHALSADELRRLEPHLSPEVVRGIHYPDDAQVQPSLATQAMLARARRLGAEFRITEVTGPVLVGDRLAGVATPDGDILADAVVNCAGPWAGAVASLLGARLDIRPRRGAILVTTPMPQRVFHKVYDADYVGAVGSSDAALQTSTVVESTPAGTVLIGSSRERVGFSTDDTLAPITEIAAKATRLFPFLAGTMLLRSYVGFRPYTPDHVPVIGADGRVDGLFHAAGHEGAGIGLAPTTGELIAHAVLGTPAPLDPMPFLPTRASLEVAA